MKKIIHLLILLFISVVGFAQTTPKDFLGINLNDSLHPLTIDSAKIEKKADTSKKTKSAYYPGMELHPHIPKAYTIDKGRAVGEIPFTTTTTSTGAMVINIPIDVPKDDNNYAPQLALGYNSNGVNSTLGMGWSISGVSQIVRTNKTVYYDGRTEGVKFGSDAAFTLDGNKLIKLSELSGASITYQAEQGNIKVTAYMNDQTFYKYFIVSYPDGSIGTYGYENEYSSIKNSYPLTKITDKDGKTINYYYTYISGHYRLDKATYGQAQQASVEFSYNTTRTDVPVIYNGGYPISYNYLLSAVTTKYNGNTLRTYSLSYGTTANVSTLSKIECSADGKSLNPLIFYYGDNKQIESFKKSDSQMMQWYDYTYAYQLRTRKGKFEYGSENDGIITLPNKNNYAEHYKAGGLFNHSENWIYNDYNGDESIFVTTGLDGQYAGFCPVLKTEAGFVDIFCADLDDFEGEEIIKVNNTISGSYDKVDFHVYTPNLYVGIGKKYTRTFNFNTLLDYRGRKSITPKFYYTGDFTGRGRTEVLAVSTCSVIGSGNNTTVYLFDLENNQIIYEGNPFNYYVQYRGDDAYKNSDKLYTVDYDGDGKTDICLIDGSGLKVFTFNLGRGVGNYGVIPVYTNSSLTKSSLIDRDFFPGDFNGDGKTDFLLSPAIDGSAVWKIYTSEGDGWYRPTDISITTKISSSRFLVQDINGDGQTDLIETYGTSDNVTLAAYLIADRTFKGAKFTSVPKESIIIPTNINNYNYLSQLTSIRNGIASRIAFQADYSKSRLLTGLVNSMGTITKIEYCKLNQDLYGMLYSKGYGAKFPYQNYLGGLNVVSATESYNNNIKVAGEYYQYSNGIIHRQGLGFRGFERIYSNDMITGEYKTTIYDPLTYGITKSIESPKGLVTYNYNVNIASNKIANVTVNNKTEKDKLKNISVTTTYTYDTYGNPTKEIVDYGDGLKATTTNTYTNHITSPYLLGELNSQTITKERTGTPAITTKMERTYNTKRLPITTKVYTNNNLVSEETYEYDSFGNLTESKSKPYTSSTWLQTKYVYDPYGRITRKTDPQGFYVDYTYDAKSQLISTKNHKGLETKNEYDEQGRLIKTMNPDGTINTKLYSWVSTPAGALILKEETSSGQPSSQVYLDALGREMRYGELRFDGKYLYTDIVYDSKGRVQKVSLPFKGTSPALWNTYTYDYYDRLTNLTYASGKKDTYYYTENSVTERKENVKRTINYDPMGNIISVADSAGVITYNLRADDRPSSITAPGGVTTSFEYDGYGRQTKLIDPSSGTSLTAYDAAGNINQQTDANGKVIKSTYDAYNRITKKEIVGELTTTYAYDTDGQLQSVSSSNGTGKTYTYDNLMRVATEKESVVDGKWLQKTFTYTNGVTSAVAYSSNTGSIATENYVYTNGNMSEIKLNNTTSIWKLTQENDLGMATGATSGTLTRTYSYDAYGMPTARIINNGATVIQNFGYSINPATGNLSWRKDNNRNIQENFTYDNLNRLTGFGGKTITYDLKGNITDHSGVGKFEYKLTAKPYAVTDITPYGTEIAQRNQTVTYNGMMRPNSITEDAYTATFAYNVDGGRVKMQVKKNNVDDLVRYYIGGQYEADAGVAGTKEKLYLGGDAYSAAAVYVKEGTGAWAVYYLGRDYLGSITHIIDASGAVKQELSYDAWGRLRNPVNQQLYVIGSEPTLFLGRGYTGHEHLPMFGLINMNARLYDPVIGRFLSPDPYVQAPDWSQNFNRFSYGLNNPLRFTDESGEIIFTLIATFVPGAQVLLPYAIYLDAAWMSAAINVIMNWDDIQANGGAGSATFWGYAGLGAVNGLGMATGQWWVVGITGTIQGGGNTWLKDGNFSTDVLIDGGWSGLVSMGSMGVGKLASPLTKQLTNAGLSQSTSSFLANYAVDYTYNFAANAVYYNYISDLTSKDCPKNWLEQSFYNSFLTSSLSAGMRSVNNVAQYKSNQSNNWWGQTLQNARNNYNPSWTNGYSTPQPQWSPYSTPTYKPNPIPPNYYTPPKR